MFPYQEKVGSKHGAPMGRQSDVNLCGKAHLRRVPMVDGDYDQGGAYWGNNGVPLWCVWTDEGSAYYRARSRAEAKALAEADGHDLTYYR